MRAKKKKAKPFLRAWPTSKQRSDDMGKWCPICNAPFVYHLRLHFVKSLLQNFSLLCRYKFLPGGRMSRFMDFFRRLFGYGKTHTIEHIYANKYVPGRRKATYPEYFKMRVLNFMRESTVNDEASFVYTKDLYSHYKDWCQGKGFKRFISLPWFGIGVNTFTRLRREYIVLDNRGKKTHIYRGIRLRLR